MYDLIFVEKYKKYVEPKYKLPQLENFLGDILSDVIRISPRIFFEFLVSKELTDNDFIKYDFIRVNHQYKAMRKIIDTCVRYYDKNDNGFYFFVELKALCKADLEQLSNYYKILERKVNSNPNIYGTLIIVTTKNICHVFH